MRAAFASITPFALAAALFLPGAAPLAAQGGFALKGGFVLNQHVVDEARIVREIPDAHGFTLGAELFLGALGVGVSGYTAGGASSFDFTDGSFNVLADLNYRLKLPLLPIAPYAGVHTGLGSYSFSEIRNGDADRPDIDFGDIGLQLGVRLQPTSLIGIDVQYRRVSGSLAVAQDVGFSTNQFLVGLTLF
jgi:hypothetical protein